MRVKEYKKIEKIIFKELHRLTKPREKGVFHKIDEAESLIKALRICESCVDPGNLAWDELNDEPDWDQEAEDRQDEEEEGDGWTDLTPEIIEREKRKLEFKKRQIERKEQVQQPSEIEYKERGFKIYDDAYDDVDHILQRYYDGDISDVKAIKLIIKSQSETYEKLELLDTELFPEAYEDLEV